MGIFSKLKEIFTKKPMESLQGFEEEIGKLQKKSNADIIALIGTQGRLKGLPLIYASNDDIDFRRYSARLIELNNPLNTIIGDKIFLDLTLRFSDSILYYRPVLKNISFFAICSNQNNITIVKQWIFEKDQALRELFHED